MKRISNMNSFSSVIDRLIIENLKIIQFVDKNKMDMAEKQNVIITELKRELDVIYEELKINEYESIGELRTYDSNTLFFDLFGLCLSNYSIAKGDKSKIEESNSSKIDVYKLRDYVHYVRNNLELRSGFKNSLENIIS